MHRCGALIVLAAAASASCSLLLDTGDLASTDPVDGAADGATQQPPAEASAPESGGDATVDAGNVFLDDFNRPDSPTLGNGWQEKNAGAFVLASNHVEKLETGALSYKDNLVFRPVGEDALDVEISVEVKHRALPPIYPQIFARLQPGTANSCDGYSVSSFSDGKVYLVRVNAGSLTSLRTLDPPPAYNTTDTYRLRLLVEGKTPVSVTGYVDQLVGTTWTTISQGQFSDSDARRLSAPGSVGFSGAEGTSYTYDNFVRKTL